jgi:3-phenylpropionate/trans-cinnamate dioxygenase ferredoxin reductase subunit
MSPASSVSPERIVVAGGGLAGLRTIEELRAAGYAGAVTLVGAEARPPYDRPPLSKRLMAGEMDDTTLRDDMHALDVELCLGQAATGLDDGVLRAGRAEHRYDRLVLATGATPVALPGTGRQRFLRTLDDALALRAVLRPGLRLAIIGAGWIGAELATAAAAAGCRVTVLEAAGAPLSVALGAELGALTAPWYTDAGVELRLGEQVAAVEPGGLALAGGEWLPADEVLTAVGVRPEVGWLDGSGVAIDNGVAADEQLRTSLPGVFAVGDCMAFWSLRYRRRLRFEHWDVALRAPAVAAVNLLGGTDTYDPVPYFWSEQFGRMVQYIGFHGAADRMLLRGDPAERQWSACWLAGDLLVALMAVNSPRDLAQGRRIIQANAAVDTARLGDPQTPLRDTIVAEGAAEG